MIKVFQQSGNLLVRAKVIPMWNDAQQTCPFLFLCMLFVSQQVLDTEVNVVCEDYGTKKQPAPQIAFL